MKTQTQEKKRLIWVGVGIWTLVALVFIGTYWKPFAKSETSHASDERYTADGRYIGYMIPDIPESEKQQFLQKARLVRDKWRPWARTHQADLQRMLDAGADDWTTRQAVAQQLPDAPNDIEKAGIAPEDVGFMRPGDPDRAPWEGIQLHWLDSYSAPPTQPQSQDPATQEIGKKYAVALSAKKQDDWKVVRDIPLVEGCKGRTDIILWASGRITQRTNLSPRDEEASKEKVLASGRGIEESDLYTPYQEIEPPFDFLRPHPNLP